MIRHIAVLAGAAALASCTTDPGFTGVTGARAVSASEVSACTYVMDIKAAPSVYGPFAQQGLEYTRNQVLATAKDGGANAVVFEPVSPGVQVTEVRAAAYRC